MFEPPKNSHLMLIQYTYSFIHSFNEFLIAQLKCDCLLSQPFLFLFRFIQFFSLLISIIYFSLFCCCGSFFSSIFSAFLLLFGQMNSAKKNSLQIECRASVGNVVEENKFLFNGLCRFQLAKLISNCLQMTKYRQFHRKLMNTVNGNRKNGKRTKLSNSNFGPNGKHQNTFFFVVRINIDWFDSNF